MTGTAAGLIVFALGSTAAAFASGTGMLIGARVVMGLGAAFVMPATLSILNAVFPPKERPAGDRGLVGRDRRRHRDRADARRPRLLRYFGEELSSQTFWASFYSRARDAYREAIKELAAKTDFAHAFNFILSFDWANKEKSVVRMTCEWTEHRENRSPRPLPLEINAFIPESCFQDFKAEFASCAIVCQELALYANLMDAGVLTVIQGNDGRLTMTQDESLAPLFQAPPGARYTKITSAVTYFGPIGFMSYVTVGPALQFGIQLRGTALPDLYFSIVHPGQGVSPVLKGMGTDLGARGLMPIGGVFIEGQSVVLSWKHKESPAGETSKLVEIAT